MEQERSKKLPQYFTFDIASRCNLECIYCPEGKRQNQQPVKFMSLKDFQTATRDILPHAESISLSNWSEPFLNPELADIIQHIKSKNPETYVMLSTNGSSSQITDATIRRVIEAGCDRIEISISGLDQKIYERYHKGGNLENVLTSLRRFTSFKNEDDLSKPHLCINYLLFPYNAVSRQKIRLWLIHNLGASNNRRIDEVRHIRGTLFGQLKENDQVLSDFRRTWNQRTLKLSYKPRCRFVFDHLVVRADGAVFPCCVVGYQDVLSFGNLINENLSTIWERNAPFRHGFIQGKNILCENCHYIHGMLNPFTSVGVSSNLRLLYQLKIHSIYHFDKILFGGFIFRMFWRNQSAR